MSQKDKRLKGYCPANQKEGGKDIKEVPTQREHRVGQSDNVEALLGKPMESLGMGETKRDDGQKKC